MDQHTLSRIESIDRLIKMLQEERETIVSNFRNDPKNFMPLKALAQSILNSDCRRESIQSEKWAGTIVMQAVFGEVKTSQSSKQQVKKILNQIVAAGHLKIASQYSTRRGRGLPIYVAP
jgi:hypothetical protein